MGMTGATGPTGATGNAATIVTGSTVTSSPGSNANVVNVGSPSAAILNFTIPAGPQGPKGDPGPSGGTASSVFGELPGGSIDGANTNFSTQYSYIPALLAVFLNGLRLRRTNDYVETDSQSFRLVSAPLPGDVVCIDYLRS
jgi:hypothetical protein